MNQFKGAKIAYVVFALVIFSLVVNIVYLGITGKHLISGSDIKTYAKIEEKVKVLNMQLEDRSILVITRLLQKVLETSN